MKQHAKQNMAKQVADFIHKHKHIHSIIVILILIIGWLADSSAFRFKWLACCYADPRTATWASIRMAQNEEP